LNLESFETEQDEFEVLSKEYKDLLDKEVLTNIRNLNVDVVDMASADESKVARNDEWLKNIKKDVYLEETLNIMKDMIKFQ
jgi:carboxyl-terminal processing protease